MTVGRKNPKIVRWNDVVKDAVERKDAAWKEVLGAWDRAAEERCVETY